MAFESPHAPSEQPPPIPQAPEGGVHPVRSVEQVGRLTRGIAKGDEGAFDRFYGLYADRLYRYLLVVAQGDEALVRDAMQDCMLRVVRYLRPFDNEEVLWGWLTRVGKSALFDLLRRRGRVAAREVSLADDGRLEQPLDETEAEGRIMNALHVALDSLPESDRHLLERHYLDGVPQKILGAERGATRKAIESRLARLRKKLKTIILDILSHE